MGKTGRRSIDGFRYLDKRISLLFLFVLIVPLLISFAYYFSTRRLLIGQIREETVYRIRAADNDVQTLLLGLNNLGTHLEASPYVRSLADRKSPYGPSPSRDSSDFAMRNPLMPVAFLNPAIRGYYVIYPEESVVLTPHGLLTYETAFRYLFPPNCCDSEEWMEKIAGKRWSHRILAPPGAEADPSDFYYLHTLPINREKTAVVLAVLDFSSVRRLFRDLLSHEGSVSVSGENGLLRFELPEGGAPSPRGRERIDYLSPKTGWRYRVVLDASALRGRIAPIMRITVLIILFFTLGGLLFDLTLAHKASAPLYRLLAEHWDANIQRQGLVQSTGCVLNKLETKAVFLKQQLSHQRKTARLLFLNNLLNGMINSEEEIQSGAELFNLEKIVASKTVWVAVVFFPGDSHGALPEERRQETDLMGMTDLLEDFEKGPSPKRVGLAIDGNTIALVFSEIDRGGEALREKTRRALQNVMRKISARGDRRFLIGVGSVQNSCKTAYRSYRQGRTVLETLQSRRQGPSLLYHDEIVRHSLSLDLIIEDEKKLIHLIKAGEEASIRQLFDQIREEYLLQKTLNEASLEALFGRLRSTILSQSAEEKNHETGTTGRLDLPLNRTNASWTQNLENLKEAAAALSRVSRRNRSSHGARLQQRLQTVFEEQFLDPGFSLTAMADCMGLSEQYVSAVFKEAFGQNYRDLLEVRRTEKAAELLLAGSGNLDGIAKMAGYLSSNTFVKAFKRRYGITPTQYRNANRTKTPSCLP